MNIPNPPSIRLPRCRLALIALGCLLSFSLSPASELKAADSASLQPRADKAPSLPLTATFEKVTGGESGPYVLHLKNDSTEAVKASAKISLSVAFHANSKSKNIPDHVIDPGQVWSIPDLASGDKVVITADGFAPLELTVP